MLFLILSKLLGGIVRFLFCLIDTLIQKSDK